MPKKAQLGRKEKEKEREGGRERKGGRGEEMRAEWRGARGEGKREAPLFLMEAA